jgi:DNA repair protein RadC
VIYELCLDRKGKLLVCKRLGEGGISSAPLDVRKLVENAILNNASSVILAHNHPSGVAAPSPEDFAATEQAQAALETVQIALSDHIIVADRDFVSFSESGYLSRP